LTSGKQHEVVIAASQFGRGRIVVMSHNTFLAGHDTDTPRHKQLLENIYRWVSQEGTSSEVVKIDKNTTTDDIKQADVLISQGGEVKNNVQNVMTAVEERVFDEGVG
ncbi:unnamed protein product, partial [Owenia fusiformis]